MDCSVSHVISHYSSAFVTFHDEIKCEIFDEENAIIAKSSAKQGVEHTVTCSVSNSATPVGLTSFAEILRLTTEGSLINLSIFSS